MKPKFANLLLAASIVVSFSGQAFAAPVIKENNLDNLNLNSSWVGGTTQPGPADIATWDATVNANQVLLLGADLSWGGINMNDVNGDVTIGAGNTLTLGASGITSAANKWIWIDAPVALGAAQTWTTPNNLHVNGAISGGFALTKAGAAVLLLSNTANNAAGGVLVTAGTLRANNNTNFSNGGLGTGPITLQSGGTLDSVFSTNNTWDLLNPIAVASGQTGNINTPNRFEMKGAVTGSGTLNMNIVSNATRADFRNDFSGFSGTLNFTGSGTMRLRINQSGSAFNGAGWTNTKIDLAGSVGTQVVTFSGGNTVPIGSLSGSSATAFLGGGTAGTATYSIGNLGIDSTYAGGITGNAALTVNNGITLTLTNTSNLTYTGGTSVSDAYLKMNGIKTGAGATNVAAYGVLTGTGSLAGTTTVQEDGVLSPGDDLVADGIGNLTFSNLTLPSFSQVDLEFGTGNDTITVASGGVLDLSAGVLLNVYDGTVNDGNTFETNGTYPIFNVSGVTVNGFNSSTFVVDNAVGKTYSFVNDGTTISMVVSDSDPSNFWDVDGDGTWEDAGNWTKTVIPDASGALAKFGPGQGGFGGNFSDDIAVTLDADQTVGELTLNEDTWVITIDPGTTTPGSLLMENGPAQANIVDVAGDHVINAPIVADADGLGIDVAETYTFTANGVVSGDAQVVKTGLGTLVLSETNTYLGGTSLAGGVVQIDTAANLGASSGAAVFSGGTLQLTAELLGETRAYQVSGASDAVIDTDIFNFGYDGVISPFGGGTGGLTKNGTGTMTLGGVSAFTGQTRVNSGIVELATGSSIACGAANVPATGYAAISVTGGSLTAGAASYFDNTNGSPHLLVSGGSASFNAGLNANNNKFTGYSIELTGGTFSATSVTMGRGALQYNTEPAGGSTTEGFYVNGAAAHITGSFSVGYNSANVNSSVSSRIDSGSLTVDGTTQIGINSGRWSILDINGGTFTSTDAVNGVLVGNNYAGNVKFLIRGTGVATAERISLQQIAASTNSSVLDLSGGALYVGSGGIVGNVNGGTGVLDVRLGTAILGAKANWTSDVAMNLNAATTVKAADALDAAFDIALSGALGGAGNLEKTGAGKLTLAGTNAYTGTTTVSAGTLAVTGDSSAANGAVSVASGAKLGGTGTIGGSTNIADGGGFTFDISTGPGSHDGLDFSGNLTLDGASSITITSTEGATTGTYTLVTGGAISGAVPSVVLPPGWTAATPVVSATTITLNITSVGSASGYDSWASDNGLTEGVNDGATQDAENDGIENVLEFVLGGNPLASDTNILPDLDASGANFVFTFNREDESEAEVTLIFQYGSNLAGWTDVAIGATSAGVVNVNEGDPVENPDVITVTIPKSGTKLFGRLQAVK